MIELAQAWIMARCNARLQAAAHRVVDQLQLLGQAVSLVQNDPAQQVCMRQPRCYS